MPATFERRNPADDREVVSTYAGTGPDGARAACDRAADAAGGWADTPGPKRAAILHRAANLLEERAPSIARGITREEGKLLGDALGETLRAVTILRFHAGEAERGAGEFAEPGDAGAIAFTWRRPLGVVGLITPWNFPIAIPAWKLAPALAAGNAVVIKPASRAPGGTVTLVKALHDAGVPEGVLELLVGGAEAGQAMVDHPAVRAVSFTGSNVVGEALRDRATRRGARFQGELGGNNPLIVLRDADLDRAADLAVSGAFGAAGQKCTATRRVIAEASVLDALVERITERAARLRVGPGLEEGIDVPPLVDRIAQEEVLAAVQETVAAGAELVAGGEAGPDAHGAYVMPTVLLDAPSGTPVIDDEVFGPVCAVLEAADVEAAIALANATPYGLSASICTNDLPRTMTFIRRIDAGMVHVNRPTPGADPHLPFGGVKGSSSSGYREQGRAAVEFFTEGRTVYLQGPT
jgi:aldehyde dehydrogenase (NAD+)